MKLFWSIFSRIRTEYGEIRSISPYSVRMRENADPSNSEYGHFLRSVDFSITTLNFYHWSYPWPSLYNWMCFIIISESFYVLVLKSELQNTEKLTGLVVVFGGVWLAEGECWLFHCFISFRHIQTDFWHHQIKYHQILFWNY